MRGYNTITASGNIINPEAKTIETANGTRQMLSWSMAFNDPMDRDNKDKTSWVRCVAWGKPAEIIEQYATEVDPASGNLVAQKGAAIVVTGTLSVQKWTNRQGERGTTVQITVQQFQLIGSNNTLTGEEESSNNGNNNVRKPALFRTRATQTAAPAPVDLDKLPF